MARVLGGATHVTGDNASIRTPCGTWPGWLSVIQTDFDRAGEKAWCLGVKYDFGRTLVPLEVPGLIVLFGYAQGTDRVDPTTWATAERRSDTNSA